MTQAESEELRKLRKRNNVLEQENEVLRRVAVAVACPAATQRSRLETMGHKEELRLAMVHWIDRTYHRRRRQRGLARLTPVENETLNEA